MTNHDAVLRDALWVSGGGEYAGIVSDRLVAELTRLWAIEDADDPEPPTNSRYMSDTGAYYAESSCHAAWRVRRDIKEGNE